jgi:hypothetical protein
MKLRFTFFHGVGVSVGNAVGVSVGTMVGVSVGSGGTRVFVGRGVTIGQGEGSGSSTLK